MPAGGQDRVQDCAATVTPPLTWAAAAVGAAGVAGLAAVANAIPALCAKQKQQRRRQQRDGGRSKSSRSSRRESTRYTMTWLRTSVQSGSRADEHPGPHPHGTYHSTGPGGPVTWARGREQRPHRLGCRFSGCTRLAVLAGSSGRGRGSRSLRGSPGEMGAEQGSREEAGTGGLM